MRLTEPIFKSNSDDIERVLDEIKKRYVFGLEYEDEDFLVEIKIGTNDP